MVSGKIPHTFVRRRHQLIHYVVEKDGRPAIGKKRPSSIQGMIESSFDSEIEKCPVSELNMFHVWLCI
ncbi:hypothetical protein ACHAXR_000913 [Thalassiosira sp. AJA248-18]